MTSTRDQNHFQCMICTEILSTTIQTVEHVFPEAIGGTYVIRDVCKPCNDYLGHAVDVGLTDHIAIVSKRHKFNLTGKNGTIPDPFPNITLNEDGHETPMTWNTRQLYRAPSRKTTDQGSELIYDPIDTVKATNAEETLRRRGKDQSTTVRIASDTMRGVITIPLPTDFHTCERGLFKIIYELACGALGPVFLDEPQAIRIRNFIRSPALAVDQSGIDGMVAGAPAMQSLAGAREELLIGGLISSEGRILGYVRLFDIVEAMIVLTDRPSSVVDKSGIAIVIDVAKGFAPPRFTTFRSLGWTGS